MQVPYLIELCNYAIILIVIQWITIATFIVCILPSLSNFCFLCTKAISLIVTSSPLYIVMNIRKRKEQTLKFLFIRYVYTSATVMFWLTLIFQGVIMTYEHQFLITKNFDKKQTNNWTFCSTISRSTTSYTIIPKL